MRRQQPPGSLRPLCSAPLREITPPESLAKKIGADLEGVPLFFCGNVGRVQKKGAVYERIAAVSSCQLIILGHNGGVKRCLDFADVKEVLRASEDGQGQVYVITASGFNLLLHLADVQKEFVGALQALVPRVKVAALDSFTFKRKIGYSTLKCPKGEQKSRAVNRKAAQRASRADTIATAVTTATATTTATTSPPPSVCASQSTAEKIEAWGRAVRTHQGGQPQHPGPPTPTTPPPAPPAVPPIVPPARGAKPTRRATVVNAVKKKGRSPSVGSACSSVQQQQPRLPPTGSSTPEQQHQGCDDISTSQSSVSASRGQTHDDSVSEEPFAVTAPQLSPSFSMSLSRTEGEGSRPREASIMSAGNRLTPPCSATPALSSASNESFTELEHDLSAVNIVLQSPKDRSPKHAKSPRGESPFGRSRCFSDASRASWATGPSDSPTGITSPETAVPTGRHAAAATATITPALPPCLAALHASSRQGVGGGSANSSSSSMGGPPQRGGGSSTTSSRSASRDIHDVEGGGAGCDEEEEEEEAEAEAGGSSTPPTGTPARICPSPSLGGGAHADADAAGGGAGGDNAGGASPPHQPPPPPPPALTPCSRGGGGGGGGSTGELLDATVRLCTSPEASSSSLGTEGQRVDDSEVATPCSPSVVWQGQQPEGAGAPAGVGEEEEGGEGEPAVPWGTTRWAPSEGEDVECAVSVPGADWAALWVPCRVLRCAEGEGASVAVHVTHDTLDLALVGAGGAGGGSEGKAQRVFCDISLSDLREADPASADACPKLCLASCWCQPAGAAVAAVATKQPSPYPSLAAGLAFGRGGGDGDGGGGTRGSAGVSVWPTAIYGGVGDECGDGCSSSSPSPDEIMLPVPGGREAAWGGVALLR